MKGHSESLRVYAVMMAVLSACTTIAISQVLPCRADGPSVGCCKRYAVNEDRWCGGTACGDLVTGDAPISQTKYASNGKMTSSETSAECDVIRFVCDQELGCVFVDDVTLICTGDVASGADCPGQSEPQ